MSENTNADATSDDTQGHKIYIQDEAPSQNHDDDTEGHKIFAFDEAPGVVRSDDDDDTQGHKIYIQDEAPGISGALGTDPKAQS